MKLKDNTKELELLEIIELNFKNYIECAEALKNKICRFVEEDGEFIPNKNFDYNSLDVLEKKWAVYENSFVRYLSIICFNVGWDLIKNNEAYVLQSNGLKEVSSVKTSNIKHNLFISFSDFTKSNIKLSGIWNANTQEISIHFQYYETGYKLLNLIKCFDFKLNSVCKNIIEDLEKEKKEQQVHMDVINKAIEDTTSLIMEENQ